MVSNKLHLSKMVSEKKMKEKSFVNFGHNGIHFNFPNGNQISAIWGWGSHTENYDMGGNKDIIETMQTFTQSNDVELMITCGEKLHKHLMRKFDGDGSLLNGLDMVDFMYVFDKVSKEKTND